MLRASRSGALLAVCLSALGCEAPPEAYELVIGGLDYAFDLPTEVPAGPAEIVFENRGQVRHEAIFVELVPGTTVTDIADAMAAGTDPDTLIRGFGGILFADPGETSWGRLSVDLEPGRTYGLVCSLTDTDDDPPHVALGMLRTFTVE